MKRVVLVVVIVATLLAVGLGGILIGRATARSSAMQMPTTAAAPTQEVWTCSMHPQVRLGQPGTCPICEMPLIPASSASDATDEGVPTMQLSEHALAMASIETAPILRRSLSKDVRAVGKVEYNESSLATITARVDGYAERLFVNFTGIDIRKNDHLVEIYSPELLVAQQELLIALSSGGSGGADQTLVETASIKLRLYGLTDAQIEDLRATRRLTERITLFSPIDGTVTERSVVQNAAFKAGDALYRIADLDTVWVYLDIYEYDLPWLRYGQHVSLTTEGYPGRTFRGMVTFVQPIVNEATRTIRVPVHIENSDHTLKPGMYMSAIISAALGADGTASPTGVEGKFTCPMHPQVVHDADGTCPICEMPLEQIPLVGMETFAHVHDSPSSSAQPQLAYSCPMKCEGEQTYREPDRCPVCNMTLEEVVQPMSTAGLLAVPVEAVLNSGTRTIAYVEKARGLFEPRDVVVGPRAGEFYPVLQGLREGERVVTRGGFLIDSQFQITGHPSLFYPGGLHASMGHQHGMAESSVSGPQQPPHEGSPPATGHQH
jgi:membrane fusion protein, copper/silver efflux system